MFGFRKVFSLVVFSVSFSFVCLNVPFVFAGNVFENIDVEPYENYESIPRSLQLFLKPGQSYDEYMMSMESLVKRSNLYGVDINQVRMENEREIEDIKNSLGDYFRLYDVNGDGIITFEEMASLVPIDPMDLAGYIEKTKTLKDFDSNEDEEITRREINTKNPPYADKMRKKFEEKYQKHILFDLDKNGKVTEKEFATLVAKSFMTLDKDLDGIIASEEYSEAKGIDSNASTKRSQRSGGSVAGSERTYYGLAFSGVVVKKIPPLRSQEVQKTQERFSSFFDQAVDVNFSGNSIQIEFKDKKPLAYALGLKNVLESIADFDVLLDRGCWGELCKKNSFLFKFGPYEKIEVEPTREEIVEHDSHGEMKTFVNKTIKKQADILENFSDGLSDQNKRYRDLLALAYVFDVIGVEILKLDYREKSMELIIEVPKSKVNSLAFLNGVSPRQSDDGFNQYIFRYFPESLLRESKGE